MRLDEGFNRFFRNESSEFVYCLRNQIIVCQILSRRFCLWLIGFCREEKKSACHDHLASLFLIDYALEQRENLLTASCLQVMLRELPGCSQNSKVMNIDDLEIVINKFLSYNQSFLLLNSLILCLSRNKTRSNYLK